MEDLSEQQASAEESHEEEKTENNSCISIYFQSKSHDMETAVRLQLLEQILEDHFYDELRNKEQCGYYVAATRRQTRGIYGFLFTIESAKFSPLELEQKIFNFVKLAQAKVRDVEVVKKFHDGLLARKKEGFKDI